MNKVIEKLSVTDLSITEYGTIRVDLKNDTASLDLFGLLSAKGATTRMFFLKGMLPAKPKDNETWESLPDNIKELAELKKRLIGEACNIITYTFEIGELYEGKSKVTISDDIVTTNLVYSEPTQLQSDDEITSEMVENAKRSILAANARRGSDMVFE